MGVSDVSSNQTKDGEESIRMSCYAASTRSSSSSSSSHCCPPPQNDDDDDDQAETLTTATTNCCHYRYCCLLAAFHQKTNNIPSTTTTTPTLVSPNRRRTPTSSTVPPISSSSSSLLPPASSPASPSPGRRCRRLCFGRAADPSSSSSSSSPGCYPGHKEQGRSSTPCKRAGVMARSRPCCCCQCDIVGFAIKCDQCVDIDLCLECFSLGAEVGPHKKDHKYRIMSDMLGPFDIPKPWSLVEETMLLDAVEQYGFGNWHDVANHVESRTAAECQDHYVSFYLFGNIGKVSVPCCNNYSFGLTNEDSVPNHKKTLNNATNNNDDSESFFLNHQKPLNNATTNSDEHDWGLTHVENNHIEQPDLGYVLFRDDYGKTSRCRRKKKTNKKSAWKRSSFLLNDVTRSELEYDNDAESLISSLSVELDDEDIDIAFKLTQVDNYRLRLQEREQRKRVAHDYGLFHYSGGNKFKSPNSKRKTTKIDREFQEKLRVFAQFNTFQEHVQYYENLARERELKNRIRELFRFRKNGLMTLAEVVVFKNRKYKRDRRKNTKNQPDSRSQGGKGSMVSEEIKERLDSQENEQDGKGDVFYRNRKKLAALFGMTYFLRERKEVPLVEAAAASAATTALLLLLLLLQLLCSQCGGLMITGHH